MAISNMQDSRKADWPPAQVLLRTFLIGSAIGASVAVLVTPRNGKQIREMMDGIFSALRDKKDEAASETREALESNAAKIRESADEIKRRLDDNFSREREDSNYR